MCDFLNEVLERSFEDGGWAEAFDTTLGMADVETPDLHRTPSIRASDDLLRRDPQPDRRPL